MHLAYLHLRILYLPYPMYILECFILFSLTCFITYFEKVEDSINLMAQEGWC